MRPSTIKGLIPDRSPKALNIESLVNLGDDVFLALLKLLLSHVLRDHVHLVHQAEDPGFWRQLLEGVQAAFELHHIFPVEVLRGDVEDVDQDLDVLEYVLPLALEKLLHKKILASAIPEG